MLLERTVPIKQVIIALAVSLLLILTTFLSIGYAYFWDKYPNKTMAEREIQKYALEVGDDQKNIAAHLNLGWAQEQQGFYDEALDQFDQALKLDPNNPTAHFNKGLVLQKKHRIDEAIAEFNKVRQLDWEYVDPTFNLAELYFAKGDYQNAISNLKYYLGVNRSSSNGHFLLGQVYEAEGVRNMAISEYRAALAYDPAYREARDALNRLGVKD